MILPNRDIKKLGFLLVFLVASLPTAQAYSHTHLAQAQAIGRATRRYQLTVSCASAFMPIRALTLSAYRKSELSSPIFSE